jgi:16S rRNA (cytosine967-C5)-methyltransferase
MKYFSYLNSATEIINLYNGKQPFHLFIKDFFRQHKKYGSADRKQITHLCYCYFRLGNSLENISISEKIITALFLCSDRSNEILAAVKPAWHEKINLPIEEKCAFINLRIDALNIFPYPGELSEQIDRKDFTLSHLIQPDVFLRCRPGYIQTIISKLQNAGISYTLSNKNCISVPNNTKADLLIALNKEAVVQDYNSQRTGDFMQLVKKNNSILKIWDCCAASGGKSILAKDIFENIDLTVSDIRETVLINLKKRFAEAGIKINKMLRADIANEKVNLPFNTFDFIIADVPCTGSGTWGRTPEKLFFFEQSEIEDYQLLQKKIITSVLPHLKKDGHLLYITCSAFKKENEDMVDFIKEKFAVEIVQSGILKGYDIKADTMFAALVRKKFSIE